MARERIRKKPMSEINVVPYIDVMLVMLVIFMITAPLLQQGVDVNLPEAAAQPVQRDDKEPLIVTVDRAGNYYLNVGDAPDKPVSNELLVQRVAAVLRHQAGTPVLVRGDKDASYGTVVAAMALLQTAGVPNVGLLTEESEKATRGH